MRYFQSISIRIYPMAVLTTAYNLWILCQVIKAEMSIVHELFLKPWNYFLWISYAKVLCFSLEIVGCKELLFFLSLNSPPPPTYNFCNGPSFIHWVYLIYHDLARRPGGGTPSSSHNMHCTSDLGMRTVSNRREIVAEFHRLLYWRLASLVMAAELLAHWFRSRACTLDDFLPSPQRAYNWIA